MSHTPAPWYNYSDSVGNHFIEQDIGQKMHMPAHQVATILGLQNNDLSNAERIVACVNACEGINPEAVEDMLGALKAISKGEGVFSSDPLEHASNCIDDMKKIARGAIERATP